MMYSSKQHSFFSLFAVFFICSLIFSCSKKKEAPVLPESTEIPSDTHIWYGFSTAGFEKIDVPQNAAAVPAKPWTESIRIADAKCASDELDKKMPAAYALVNRLGMLVFNGDTPRLHTDVSLFSENTAGNLFFENNSPVFSVYKSVFFNDTASTKNSGGNSNRPFLIEFNGQTSLFFPLITYENLNLGINAQITDFTWNRKQFLCSVKETNNQKNIFSYISITPSIPLLSVTPSSAKTSFLIGESTAEKFRSSQKPQNFATAPERLKQLLSAIPVTLPFYIECSYAGGANSVLYRQTETDQNIQLEAHAIIADTWALAIFPDGTTYFSGSCFNRPMLLNGKTVAFRLPKLPKNFNYSYFALSGTQLYVGWEETSFYQTARSGFISVNLDEVLYSRLRRSSAGTENTK